MATSFIGRQTETAAIAAAIGDGVVTVVGPGGVGKTTTAIRAAEASGVPFVVVELTSLTPDDVAAELDQADAELLVIDNAEHVLDAVTAWLGQYDGPVLVTSRTPLGVANEWIVALPPLPTNDAVQLFVDRAERAGVTVTDHAVVAELCARLDHLPLAIELAAARARLLSPAAMTQRIDDRFRVLGEDKHATQEHHRTLRAAIAWSFDLLSDDERASMQRIAVFADRFDLEQAGFVGVDLDTLGSLLDHSLVAAEPDALVPYRLLESVRDFAREAATPDLAGVVSWLTDFTAPLDAQVHDRDTLHSRLDISATDVRRALEHADPTTAVTLFGRLGSWFWDRGRAEEGLRVGRAIAEADTGSDALATARLANAIANLAVRSGDPASALPLYEQALDIRDRAGVDAAQIASNRNDLGACLLHLGRLEEAEASLQTARDLYESADDRWGVATATANLAAVAVSADRLEGAARAFAEVAAEFTRLGDNVQTAAAFTNHGLVLLQLNDPNAAAVLARAVRTSLRSGMRAVLPTALAGCASAAGSTARGARLLGAATIAGFVDDGELRDPLENALGLDNCASLLHEGMHATEDDVLAWIDDRTPSTNEWRPTGDGWAVAFDGKTANVPAIKGMQFLAHLLASPGKELHVTELMGVTPTHAGTELVDDAALAAYRGRIAELQHLLDQADSRGDATAAIETQAELDQLTAEIRRATSKGGRVRLTGDDSERARKAVSNRIRDAIRTISDVHPSLGRHLEKSVTTGAFCVYEPERPTTWETA